MSLLIPFEGVFPDDQFIEGTFQMLILGRLLGRRVEAVVAFVGNYNTSF
jgi:hypothetical protein